MVNSVEFDLKNKSTWFDLKIKVKFKWQQQQIAFICNLQQISQSFMLKALSTS